MQSCRNYKTESSGELEMNTEIFYHPYVILAAAAILLKIGRAHV